jgi:pimeloyl-ACP methyl ester carboxylesterase
LDGVRTPCYDSAESAPEAVLFVHGNPGCGADWLPFMQETAPFVRSMAPDMPGFGRADKPADFNYTVAGYATHLARLIEARGLERVHLVLHDFGGPWGLAWAAANVARVASVTLVNIGVMPAYRWHYVARIWRTPILGELFQLTTTRAGFNLALKHGNPRGLPKDFVDRMYEQLDWGTKRAVLKLYRATSAPGAFAEQARAAFSGCDFPCLVIWGKHDPYVPWRYAEYQRAIFRRAEIVYFEDSGHWPFADNPPAFSAALVPFLRRVVGRG